MLHLSHPVSPVVTTSLFLYLWACFFLFFSRFHLSDHHISFILFCLTYFTKLNTLQIHSCCWDVVEFHFLWLISIPLGFAGDRYPDKESACQAGDTGLIPGLGREDPLGKEMATHSSILAWDRETRQAGVGKRVRHNIVTRRQ